MSDATRTQHGTKPRPPPDWDDEDAVLAYTAMEVAHGHDHPDQPEE